MRTPFGLTRGSITGSEPVLLADAKWHCKVEHDADDGYLRNLITGAREQVEEDTCRALVRGTWTLTLDRFPCDRVIRLPRPPFASVTSVAYRDAAGTLTTLDASAYVVDSLSEPARIVPAPYTSWPTTQAQRPSAVVVTYTAGFADAGDAANVPKPLWEAMLLLICHRYENRAEAEEGAKLAIPNGYERLISNYRCWEWV